VLGIILACTIGLQVAGLALGRVWTVHVAVINLGMFAIMAVTCLAPQRSLNLCGLSAMIAVLAYGFIVNS
jgi:hypothetical protein